MEGGRGRGTQWEEGLIYPNSRRKLLETTTKPQAWVIPVNKTKLQFGLYVQTGIRQTYSRAAVRPKRHQNGHRRILETHQVHPFVIFSFLLQFEGIKPQVL